ncbi:MAG TPA: peptidoglycan-associated lipoprotein Pal [Rhodocyclaceae bacterium]
MQRTLIALAVCGLLSACSSTPEKAAEAPASKATAGAAAETDAQKMDRIVKLLASKSIYFDYDNYSIKPEYQAALKQDFDLLNSAPGLALRVEGNADERGSTEYNLALGQKRAEAVRRALVMLGVPDARLEAVSYGKEKPRATCHEEKCWAEDRRVDFARKTLEASR